MPAIPTVLSTLAEKASPSRTALIIVDMVNDFVDPAGKTAMRAGRPVEHAQAAIPVQRQLLEAARRLDVPVIHVQHTTLPNNASDSGSWVDARSRATYSVRDICLDGTWGQAIIDDLRPAEQETVVKKYRYSGFAGTNLDLVLRSLQRESIICCGVSTNVCVEATAREAFSLDYYVIIPSDACASWDPELHESALKSAAHRYATVCTAHDLLSVWRGHNGSATE